MGMLATAGLSVSVMERGAGQPACALIFGFFDLWSLAMS